MPPLDGWLEVGAGRVGPEHIDYNGHMNVVHARAAFDASPDGLFAHLGLGPEEYNARSGSTLMVVEEHTRYHAELAEGSGTGSWPGWSATRPRSSTTCWPWRTSTGASWPPPTRSWPSTST